MHRADLVVDLRFDRFMCVRAMSSDRLQMRGTRSKQSVPASKQPSLWQKLVAINMDKPNSPSHIGSRFFSYYYCSGHVASPLSCLKFEIEACFVLLLGPGFCPCFSDKRKALDELRLGLRLRLAGLEFTCMLAT